MTSKLAGDLIDTGKPTLARRRKVLLAEDPSPSRSALELWLRDREAHVTTVDTLDDLMACALREAPELLLVDVHLPGGNVFEFLRSTPANLRGRTVLLTARREVDFAIQAVRLGLRDFLIKPVDFERLETIVKALAPIAVPRRSRIDGNSPYAIRLRERIDELSETEGVVVIRGEFGSGRRRVADAIHYASARGAFPLLRLSANSVFDGGPSQARLDSLLESIGHGSLVFTDVDRLGARGAALLDWIGARQGRLEPRVFVISDRGEHAPVLRDLARRTRTTELRLEPLRTRGEDLEALILAVLSEVSERHGRRAELGPGVLNRLQTHPWPRGLHDLVDGLEDAVGRGIELIRWGDLNLPSLDSRVAVGKTLAEVERELILATLDSVGHDKTQAARILGVCRKTIYNRLAAYRADEETPTHKHTG
ncbi:MAG: response regulator [Planctomycetota bacterium]